MVGMPPYVPPWYVHPTTPWVYHGPPRYTPVPYIPLLMVSGCAVTEPWAQRGGNPWVGGPF